MFLLLVAFQVVARRILSFLPSSLPLLSPIAHLLAAKSGPSGAAPSSSQPQSLKRKRASNLEQWIDFAYASMAECFEISSDESLVQPKGITEKEKRHAVVKALKGVILSLREIQFE